MENSEIFQKLLENLEIPVAKKDNIYRTLNSITKKLNKNYYFYDSENKNRLIAGSYGRETATDNISDLDILYILPKHKYIQYRNHTNNGPSKLLQEVKNVICSSYPKTKIRGDGQVVVFEFSKILLELCPVFEDTNSGFIYPDSNNSQWKNTNPIAEINETKKINQKINNHHYNFCKILRAWKIHNGVRIGGLAIDTLCYNFLLKKKLDEVKFSNYLNLFKEIFTEWTNISKEKKYWIALGSNQKVYRKKRCNLVEKSEKALKYIVKLIDNPNREANYLYWKELFGKYLPKIRIPKHNITNTEEFIEQKFPIDLKEEVILKCEIEVPGFRKQALEKYLQDGMNLRKNINLYFKIDCDIKENYDVYWKIKNEQDEAEEKNQIRGQIIKGSQTRTETTSYIGIHTAEVYIIIDNICVARNRLEIPIN